MQVSNVTLPTENKNVDIIDTLVENINTPPEDELVVAETVEDIILQNINWPIRDTIPGNKYTDQTQLIPCEVNNEKDLLAFYNTYQAEHKAFLKKSKEAKVDRTSEEFKTENEKYLSIFNTLQQLAGNVILDNKLNDFFTRKVALTQIVEGKEGKQIKNTFPRLDTSRISGELTGDLANAFMRKASGGGKEINSVEWHSGLLMKLSPMSKKEFVTLHTAIVKARWEVGRDTRLSIFSGDDVAIQTLIVDTILQHVENSNLKDTKINYKSILKVTDIPNLQLSALASLYPLGYPVTRVCTYVNDKQQPCKHIHTTPTKEDGDWVPDGLIDFNNLTWVDPTHLTLDMKLHLSSGFNIHTLADVLAYQENLEKAIHGLNTPVVIAEDEDTITSITYKIPTIEEYEIAGNMYKAMLINLFDTTIVDDGTMSEQQIEIEKATILKAYTNTLKLCRHLAWVKQIIFTSKQNPDIVGTISNIADIFKNLESLSDIDGCKEIVEETVENFKEKSLIAFQGINNYNCPSCGRGQIDKPTRNTSLIGLHMVSYFFSTIQRYISKVTA
jgi:hypothetical protein